MRRRTPAGGFIAEHVAVVLVLFLALTFPLLNMTTLAFRYGLLVTAVWAAARDGSLASTIDVDNEGNFDPQSVSAVVPQTVQRCLDRATGISVLPARIFWRITAANIEDGAIQQGEWNANPFTSSGGAWATPDSTKVVYSLECRVVADVNPIVVITGPLVPAVPGLTQAVTYDVSTQAVLHFLPKSPPGSGETDDPFGDDGYGGS
jgi:hypothetical protein